MTQSVNEFSDPDWLKESRDKRIVLTVPGMERVRVLKDLTYKQVPTRDLQADVYLPPDVSADEVRPGVIFIHGGYLPPNLLTQPKDWGFFRSYGQLLAQSGFTAITFNHRYYGADFLKTAHGDVKDLISFVRNHAQEFRLDEDHLHLWVFSGGGPLISWVLRELPTEISSLSLYYPILDILPQGIGLEIPEQIRLNFSPVHQLQNIKGDIFPIFIARAGLDKPALNQTIDQFIQIALSKNVALDFCNHACGQHGFDILDDVGRSHQIILRTIDFIRDHN
jgi:acetyl esterase/lipase